MMWSKTGLAAFARSKSFAVIVSSALSTAAGVTGGYVVARKRLELKYDQILREEIAEARKFYSMLQKKGDFATPESAANVLIGPGPNPATMEKAAQALLNYQGVESSPTEQDVPTPPRGLEPIDDGFNIFRSSSEENENPFDWDARDKSKPYVITKQEFFENKDEYDQIQLTYYEGDDVLADSNDQVVDDTDTLIGGDVNLQFGVGSEDRNIVYIQNDDIGHLIEIVHVDGKFAQMVLGFMEHSDQPRIRRFRRDD